MKVRDLKKGMILKPVDKHEFMAPVYNDSWLHVRKRKDRYRMRQRYLKPEDQERKVDIQLAVYLGRKEDVGSSKSAWSDRYVLFENKICPVDPHSWRKIEPVKDEYEK